MSESDTGAAEPKATSVLFDLRMVIAVLFAVYGVVCLVWGVFFFTDADSARAGGINVNLWTGIGMLVLSALFGCWAVSRPLAAEQAEAEAREAQRRQRTDPESGPRPGGSTRA